MYAESTTWTMGRILARLLEAGDEVVVFAGNHAHRGVIRGVGEYLVTLQAGPDVLAISLPSVTSVQLVGGALELPDGEVDLEHQSRHGGAARPPQPRAHDTWDDDRDDGIVDGFDMVEVVEVVEHVEVVEDVEVADVEEERDAAAATGPAAPTEPIDPPAEEWLAADAARRTEELQDWVRRLRED